MSGHRIGSRPTHRRPPRSPVAQIMAPLRREPVSGQALVAFLVVAILCHLLPWATITGNVLTSTDIGFGSISGVFSALLIIAALVIAMWWMFMPTPMVRYLIIAIIVCALISLAIQYAAFADARSGRTLVGLDG
ncbi:MAG: hypothetical protein H0W83_17830, partial [Planctomycetes bacterium]|nr:hypothetical protein [Planctomycetota bacterium]